MECKLKHFQRKSTACSHTLAQGPELGILCFANINNVLMLHNILYDLRNNILRLPRDGCQKLAELFRELFWTSATLFLTQTGSGQLYQLPIGNILDYMLIKKAI